eukprot:Selendium_serpulae@DN5653_c0_g1_i1.p1
MNCATRVSSCFKGLTDAASRTGITGRRDSLFASDIEADASQGRLGASHDSPLTVTTPLRDRQAARRALMRCNSGLEGSSCRDVDSFNFRRTSNCGPQTKSEVPPVGRGTWFVPASKFDLSCEELSHFSSACLMMMQQARIGGARRAVAHCETRDAPVTNTREAGQNYNRRELLFVPNNFDDTAESATTISCPPILPSSSSMPMDAQWEIHHRNIMEADRLMLTRFKSMLQENQTSITSEDVYRLISTVRFFQP